MAEYHKVDISEVTLEFGTDLKVGRINVDPNRKRSGSNTILHAPTVDNKFILRKITSEASLLLLIGAYIIAAVLGYYIEAIVAISLLLAAFVTSYFLKFISERHISASYRRLFPKAKVIENGKRKKIDFTDIEVGDLIYFYKGDIIPADARLVSSENLYLTEKFYNGINGKNEVKTFKKNCSLVYSEDVSLSSYDNMVYAGSAVASGKGAAIVTAIGANTRAGDMNNELSVVQDLDRPSFLIKFESILKKLSLCVLISLIPVSLLAIYFNTQSELPSAQNDILSIFLLMLALSATTMSELIKLPASFIISDSVCGDKDRVYSGVTRFSSLDKMADVNTVLILSPDVLVDKKQRVRRVFMSDREYRFDSLKSNDLMSLAQVLYHIYNFQSSTDDIREVKAIKKFVSEHLVNHYPQDSRKCKYLRNFPIEGARACVFSTIEDKPIEYFVQSDNIEVLAKCEHFKTDGGSLWRFDDQTRERVLGKYASYCELGLKTYIYASKNNHDEALVFEGIIAIGEEFPFSDGRVAAEFAENNINIVFISESESNENVKFALNCGLINEVDEIIFASDIEASGKGLSDVALNFKVYLGFSVEQIGELFQLAKKKGNNILPIIKDWTYRRFIATTSVFSTQSEGVLDSVKVAASSVLRSADAETRIGGISDMLNCIRNSALARAKLEAFKKYLIFTSFARLGVVVLSLVQNNSPLPISPLMILLLGLIGDFFALFVISAMKTSFVLKQDFNRTVSQRVSLISDSCYALGGFFASFCISVLIVILLSYNLIQNSNTQVFCMYSLASVQLFALGAILLSMKSAVKGLNINYLYVSLMLLWIITLICQFWLPDDIYVSLTELKIYRLNLTASPFVIVLGLLSFAFVRCIERLKNSFFKHRAN